MSTARLGALSVIVFAVVGIAWFALEIAPPALGFEDTDSPAVMLPFLRQHSELSVYAGIAVIIMAITLTVATFTVSDVVAPRANSLAIRSTSALGIFSAAFLFMGLLGPLGVLPDDMPDVLWIVFMVSIPGVMLWCLVLGLVLLRGSDATRVPEAQAA
jgi:hypothetical protein